MTCYLFGHRKSMGKNYCADVIGLPQLSFAGPLKTSVEELYGLSPGYCDIPGAKDSLVATDRGLRTLRDVLVFEGMSARLRDPLVWVKLLEREAPRGDFIVTDFRFPNEFSLRVPHRVVRVLVTRPGVCYVHDEADDQLSDDPCDWDFHLESLSYSEILSQWEVICEG